MALVVRKLEPSHPVRHFDCGDEELNEFLRRYAVQNQERHMYGTTYVAFLPNHDEIIGYYTLASSSIPRLDLPQASVQGQPKYPHIPCILLARIAIAKRHAGKGHGEALIRDCMTNALLAANICNARYIIADAYIEKVNWYERYGFIQIPGGTDPKYRKMFLDLRVVKAAISRGRNG